MIGILVIFSIVSCTSAIQDEYILAFDTAEALNAGNLRCLMNDGYKNGIFRIYADDKGDKIGLKNAFNAHNVNLPFEVYVTHTFEVFRLGDRDFESMYWFARDNFLEVNRVWLQVNDPINWEYHTEINVKYIKDFVRAAYLRKVKVGLFTSWYDYQLIIEQDIKFDDVDEIWYWSQLGRGISGESERDFKDFRPIGPYTKPLIKQFGSQETICGVLVNRNVYKDATRTTATNSTSSIPVRSGAKFNLKK